MKIFLGSDHAGFKIKEELKSFLIEGGHDVTDFGAHELKVDDDFPDYVIPVAKAVAANALARGIVVGGSGQGEAICANRIKGIRAVVYYGREKRSDLSSDPRSDLGMIEFTREHNDANILSLGARFLDVDDAKNVVSKWISTEFSKDERHIRRLSKIDDLSKR